MPCKHRALLEDETQTYREIKKIFHWVMEARCYQFGYAVEREDVFHDVLLELLTYLDDEFNFQTGEMEGIDNRTAFLKKTFIYKSNKIYEREKSRSTNVVRDHESENSMAVRSDDNGVVGGFAQSIILNLVPPGQREVFRMRQEGYKHKEISEALGITVAASKRRIQRARESLILALEGERKRYLT